MTYEEIRSAIEEAHPEALFFERPSYQAALIGYTDEGQAVYDREKCIECLMEECEGPVNAPPADDAWTDAVDFFEFNTVRALPYMGKHAPVIREPESTFTVNVPT